MINLKIKNNVIDGGYDSQSRNSDTVFAFAFSVSPGSIEVFNPTNPVHLNILATNQALGKLQVGIQDPLLHGPLVLTGLRCCTAFVWE